MCQVLVIADDDDSYSASSIGGGDGGKTLEAEAAEAAAAASTAAAAARRVERKAPPRERVLFCGWRRDMTDMIRELDYDIQVRTGMNGRRSNGGLALAARRR